MAREKTKLWYLRNLEMFSHMREQDYMVIARYSEMRDIKRGETLYLQGSPDRSIYILKKGIVKISKLTSQGKEITLDIVKEGTIFGEMTYAGPEDGGRDESAEVLEDGLICIVKKENFDRILDDVPGLAMRLTKMIGFRRWKIENKLLDLLYSTVEQRLVKTILNLLDDFGVPHPKGYLLKLKLTHKEFADLIASTRETVTASFNRLREGGLIDYEGKRIIVTDPEKLRALAK